MTTKTTVDLDKLVLKPSSHSRRGYESVCLMEAVAWVAGEKHGDHPECVSPVLSAFGRGWNDGMRSDEEREQLKQYIPMLIGTAGDTEADERRAWMATDWLVRVFTPAWLRLAGLDAHATMLAALQPIANAAYAASVQGELDAASTAAEAARSAAWSAAGSAARSAAWSAAWSAAGSAARSAARSAAWSAAWSAAESAARSAAWSAAGSAARSAAWSAAWSAAGSAARSAAESALEPTTLTLQMSAHDLYGRMIRAEEIPAEWPEFVLVEVAAEVPA